MNRSHSLEPLEHRVLLAHVGLDPGFGDNGVAPVAATTFISEVPGGKIIAVDGDQAVRLNPDGTLDPTFADAHASDTRTATDASIGGERLFIGGYTSQVGSPAVFVRALQLSDGSADTSFGDGGVASFIAPRADASLGSGGFQIVVSQVV